MSKSSLSSAVLSGLIGKKLGMTQVGDAAGRVTAVTVIQLGPCAITQIKTPPTDGYSAVQVTWGKRKLSRVTKAQRGHFAKAEVAAGVATREFTQRSEGELKLGQAIGAADVFKAGDAIDVSGVSKGHGYAGVIKRHHFAGFPGSHGTHEYFRHGGSIGNRSYPGRVRKGLRMAGQMGNEKATIMNLRVVDILTEDNAILVSGSVPGPDGGLVIVKHAARQANLTEQANG
jgi:large subunit ribosomal protein L3